MSIATLGLEQPPHDLHAPAPQESEAAAGHARMRIATACHDTTDAGLADRCRAGSGASLEVAGLEGDGERGPLQGPVTVSPTCLGKGHDLGVGTTGRAGRAATENAVAAVDHGTDAGVWMGPALTPGRQTQGFAQHPLVPGVILRMILAASLAHRSTLDDRSVAGSGVDSGVDSRFSSR